MSCQLSSQLWDQYVEMLRKDGRQKADNRFQMTALHIDGCPDDDARRASIERGLPAQSQVATRVLVAPRNQKR